jgi:hypothetical protein
MDLRISLMITEKLLASLSLIPIKSWNEFKAKYRFSDNMFFDLYLSPGQAQTLNQRIANYFPNPIETFAWQDVKHQLESKI